MMVQVKIITKMFNRVGCVYTYKSNHYQAANLDWQFPTKYPHLIFTSGAIHTK